MLRATPNVGADFAVLSKVRIRPVSAAAATAPAASLHGRVAHRGNVVTETSSKLVSGLRLAPKLALLVVLMMVPTLFAGTSYLSSVNDEIALTTQELSGTEVIVPALHALVELTQDETKLPDLAQLTEQVAKHPQFALDEAFTAVTDAASQPDSAKTRSAIAVALKDFIGQVGNESNLVLDPQLDTYYIMDALVFQMPRALTEHLEADAEYLNVADSAGSGAQALIKQNVATQAVLAGTLKTAGETVVSDVAASAGAGPAWLEESLTGLKVFAAALDNESTNLESTLQKPAPSDFTMPASSASDAIDPATAALADLLQTRADHASGARNLTIAGITAVTLLALGWAYMVWSNTRFAVGVVLNNVRALARRDLSPQLRAPGKDEFAEIGDDLETARTQLSKAFAQLASASGQVAESARHLTSSTLTVDGSAQETLDQSQSVNREILSVQEMLAAVADSGNELSHATHEISSTMAQVNEAAQRARGDLDRAAQMAGMLGDSSQRIAQSVTAIQAIAAKTRLLALNATIEAARAGEAGRGFAVVAGEVQALAQQSAIASEAIGQVADEQHEEIDRVIAALQQAAVAVSAAADAQATVAAAAEQQTATIAQVTDSITGSAEATTRIADQVSRVETVAFGTAGTVTQLRQAADEFDAVAKSLSEQVDAFTLR